MRYSHSSIAVAGKIGFKISTEDFSDPRTAERFCDKLEMRKGMTMIDLREATKSIDKNARILDLKCKLLEQLAAFPDGSGVQTSLVEQVSDLRRLHKESAVTAVLIMEAVSRQAPDLVVAWPGELAQLTEALNRHQTAAAKAKEFLGKRDAKAQHNLRGEKTAREIKEFLENERRRERRQRPN